MKKLPGLLVLVLLIIIGILLAVVFKQKKDLEVVSPSTIEETVKPVQTVKPAAEQPGDKPDPVKSTSPKPVVFVWQPGEYQFVFESGPVKFTNLYQDDQSDDLSALGEDGDEVCVCIEEPQEPFRTWCCKYTISLNAYEKPWQEFALDCDVGVPGWVINQQTAKPMYPVTIKRGACDKP